MQTPTLTQTAPGFYSWSFFNPEVKTGCSSHVFVHDQSLVLIDPNILPEGVEADLKKIGTPVAILLTNGNHSRAALQLKKQLTVPIGAGANAVDELHFIPEIIVDSLVQLHGLKPVPLHGGGAGEFAFYSEKSKTVVVGDALINPENSEFALLPEKYCTDAKLLKASLAKLLTLDFDHLLMAHGSPILGSARAQLESLLQK